MDILNDMYKTAKILFPLFLFISPAAFAQQSNDKVFHYSTMEAMRNAVYNGEMTIADLSKKGDFGLGTYNQLDGELIALDGKYYHVSADGKIVIVNPGKKIPFASVTFFHKDSVIELNNINDFAALQQAITKVLPSQNHFYAVRIHITFDSIATGGARKVAIDETKGIAEFMNTRPVYKATKKSGTIVGFYCPPFIGGVDLSPYHFHFISDDRQYGGHLISGTFTPGTIITVELDLKENYEIVLPLAKDNKGYQKVWKPTKAQSSY